MLKILLIFFIFILNNIYAEDISLGIKGWEATQNGEYEKALKLYEECIKTGNLTNSSLARTYRNIVITHKNSGQPEKAIEYFNKSLSLKPNDPWADYINIGNSWSDLNDFDKSFENYDLALELKPNYNEVYYNQGIVYERMNQLDNAKECFIKAYEHGLRSKLLYERFIAYNLIQNDEVKTDELPIPPEGYNWEVCNEIKAAFLKPKNWFFKKQIERNMFSLYITKENIDIERNYKTGLSIIVTSVNLSDKNKYLSDYSKQYIDEVKENKELIENPWENNMGPFKSFGVVVKNIDKENGNFISHHLSISNDKTGTIYLVVFEAPAENWEEAWGIGEPILQKLYIDDTV